jgi:hypothetical protein
MWHDSDEIPTADDGPARRDLCISSQPAVAESARESEAFTATSSTRDCGLAAARASGPRNRLRHRASDDPSPIRLGLVSTAPSSED